MGRTAWAFVCPTRTHHRRGDCFTSSECVSSQDENKTIEFLFSLSLCIGETDIQFILFHTRRQWTFADTILQINDQLI